jgi:hypothetical protein
MACRSFGCFRQDGILASSAHSPAAAHVTATEAAIHVAPAEAAAHMAATATAAACLCTGGEKAAGQYRACQNHHYSSSHDILLGIGGLSAAEPGQTLACTSWATANVAIAREVGMLTHALD